MAESGRQDLLVIAGLKVVIQRPLKGADSLRIAGLLFVACVAVAQSKEPEFEAASIKPSGPIENDGRSRFVGWKGGPGTDDPSRYTCTYCNVFMLIEDAYEIPYYRLANAGQWPDTRYHVIAAIPEGTTKAQFHRMLQNLLADRFKLAVHRETREMQTFRLLVADGGLKAKQYVEGEPRREPDLHEPGIYYKEQGRTMAEFAEFVAGYLAKPVIDATGLDGTISTSGSQRTSRIRTRRR